MTRRGNNIRVVLSDSEPTDDDDANATKQCSIQLISNDQSVISDVSDKSNDEDSHHTSYCSDDDELGDDTPSATSINSELSRCVSAIRSDNRTSMPIGEPTIFKKEADAGGINLHNIRSSSPRALDTSDPSQNDGDHPGKRQRLTRGHGRSTVSYDMKHHPMDDVLRPKYSAKRRARGEEFPKETGDSDSEINKATNRKIFPLDHRRRRSSRNTHQQETPMSYWASQIGPDRRRSARVSSSKDAPPNYDMKYHVMDATLRPKASAKRMMSKLHSISSSKTHSMLVSSAKLPTNQLRKASPNPLSSDSGYHKSDSAGHGPAVAPVWSQLACKPVPVNKSKWRLSENEAFRVKNQEAWDMFEEESDTDEAKEYSSMKPVNQKVTRLNRSSLECPPPLDFDAAFEELWLPAEQYMTEVANQKVTTDMVELSSDSRNSEPTKVVAAYLDTFLNELRSVASGTKAANPETSPGPGLAQQPLPRSKDERGPGVGFGPREWSDGPQTPKAQIKAKKRKAKVDVAIAVHEDLPGRTPVVKKIVSMNPTSPGTDLPKENLDGNGFAQHSSQAEMGTPRIRRQHEAISTPSSRHVRRFRNATGAALS